jgi:hypothetical protein
MNHRLPPLYRPITGRSYYIRCAGAEEAERWTDLLRQWIIYARNNPPPDATLTANDDTPDSKPTPLQRLGSLFSRQDSLFGRQESGGASNHSEGSVLSYPSVKRLRSLFSQDSGSTSSNLDSRNDYIALNDDQPPKSVPSGAYGRQHSLQRLASLLSRAVSA